MQTYRVHGELTYITYCSCSHCMGHGQKRRIDKLVEATSPEAARLHCIPYDYDADDAEHKLTVEDAPQDRLMRAMGMPTLFEEAPQ